MITIYQRTVKQPSLTKLEAPVVGTWIHAVKPTRDEFAPLLEQGFDESLITDALDFYEVPRFEYEDSIVYFFTRYPYKDGIDEVTAPFLIAISERLVLTIALEDPPFLARFKEGKVNFFTTQKTKLFLQLLSEINTLYQRNLTDIRREVHGNRINIRNIRNRDIANFVTLESTLNEFVAALDDTNDALKSFLAGSYVTLYEDDTDIIKDLELANEQLIASAKANLKTIQNVRSAYSTIVSNNLNQVMKFLAALTIIITIPMIVSSFYGMNVPIPFAEQPAAFWGILFFTCALMTIAGYIFSKKDWI